MNDLIARLEKATEPSRELDCLIGVAIGRFKAEQSYGRERIDYVEILPTGGTLHPGYGGDQLIPRYTESIDAAMQIVPDGLYWMTGFGKRSENEPLGGAATFLPGCDEPYTLGEGSTPSIALCIAGLNARLLSAGQREVKS